MNTKTIAKVVASAAVAVVFGYFAGIGTGVALAGDGSEKGINAVRADDPDAVAFSYAVNSAGESYGSLADSTSINNFPDLVLVAHPDGSGGYVLAMDLFDAEGSLAEPASPMEAVRQSQELEARGPVGLDVYDRDGNPTGEIWWMTADR